MSTLDHVFIFICLHHYKKHVKEKKKKFEKNYIHKYPNKQGNCTAVSVDSSCYKYSKYNLQFYLVSCSIILFAVDADITMREVKVNDTDQKS